MTPPDPSAAQQAASSIASHMAPVNAYIQTVTQLPLGPQPLIVSGNPVGGTFDPLGGTPWLSGALAMAQRNCWTFQANVLDELYGFPTLLQIFSGQIEDNFQQLQGMVSNLLAGSSVPAASAQSALQEILELLSPCSELLSGMTSGTTLFLQELSGDDGALNEGVSAIGASISKIDQWVVSAVIATYPLVELGEVIEEIGSQMTSGLQAIAADISCAMRAAPPLPQALGQLEDVFATAVDYYQDVSTQLASASDSQVFTILQALDVQASETFWQDLVTYIALLGSGSVH